MLKILSEILTKFNFYFEIDLKRAQNKQLSRQIYFYR